MSWSEIKKAVNSDLSIPLNELFPKLYTATGETISAGDLVGIANETTVMKWSAYPTLHELTDAVVFESAAATYISAVSIGTDKVLIAYRDGGNSGYGTAIVGTINGSNWTWGSPVVFESASTTHISTVSIDTDKVLIAYRDGGNSSYGTAIVGTISGTVPTFGTAVVFESAETTYISTVSIDTDKVLIAYQDADHLGYGTAIVGTISGTVPTFGTEVVFESAATAYISAVSIGTDKVLIAYKDGGNSNYGTAIVGTISGTVPTFGTAVVFESAETTYISTVSIDTDKVLIAYRDAGNSSYETAIVGTISGTVPTFGTAVVFESAETTYISTVSIDTDKVLIAYRDEGNSNYGTAIAGTISGTVPTFGTAVVFESADTTYTSAVLIGTDKVLIAYRDEGNSGYGTAIVGATDILNADGVALSNEGIPNRYVAVQRLRT